MALTRGFPVRFYVYVAPYGVASPDLNHKLDDLGISKQVCWDIGWQARQQSGFWIVDILMQVMDTT